MKQIVITLFISFFYSMAFAQFFEGKIVYTNTYKSKNPKVSDAQLTAMLGSVQDYYIKGGNYKSVTNGQLVQWQLYIAATNKIYNKMKNSSKVLPIDARLNDDELLSAEVEEGAAELLGYQCDKLILTCKSGVQIYFFAPELMVDNSLYRGHAFGNYYAYLLLTNAIALKMIINAPNYQIETVATSVEPVELKDSMFKLRQ